MPTPLPTPPADSDSGPVASDLLALVDTVARELHAGNRGLSPALLDSSLERDLALDSLARVELGSRCEREFNCTLPEAVLFEAETPRDLLRALIKSQHGAPLKSRARLAAQTDIEDIRTPLHAETLIDMLEWYATRHAMRPHIQFYDDYTEGEILTYGAVWAAAVAVAAGLQARGLAPGATVALMLPTGSDYFHAFYGVILAGGVPVPIYPPVRRTQLEDHLRRQARILGNAEARLLIATADDLPLARLLTAAVPSLRHVVTVAQLQAASAPYTRVRRAPGDLAFLQYTSGSTGDPKGVMLTHANLLANIRADGQGMAVSADDVFVSWLPLYHDMGLIGAWLGSLYHAVRLVIMPPLTFLARPQRWLWAMHRYGGTLSAAPNFAFDLCVNRIADDELDGLDLSRWRIAANGAEAISAQTLDAFCTRFGAWGFRREAMFPVYGLAECAVGLTFTPLGRGPLIDRVQRERLAQDARAEPVTATTPAHATRAVVACGLPLPRHEVRVVDAADRELPERQEGRVQFRGPSATAGYYGNAAETARLIRDGWLESGDRGYIAAGELYLTGRSKDIIIRAGRNIYPAELEDAIGDLEGIRKGHVAVFGSIDAQAGTERVVVLAETRKRKPESQQALRIAINTLAADLIAAPPDDIVLAPPNTVLRTSSGKIRRAASRALYERKLIGKPASAVWVQVLRLALAGVTPQLARRWRDLGAWAYASYAWAVFVVLGVLAWLVASLPLPAPTIWRLVRGIARAVRALSAIRVDVQGLEHLPPPATPCVIVSNHQSYLDGPLLLAALPRPLRFMVKAELRDTPLLGRPLARLGALFVERFDPAGGIAGLQAAAATLERGAALVVFPEGTFKRMPGVLPFHMGAFTLAASSAVAVIPVAVRGTRSLLRADGWFLRRGRVCIDIGAPVIPAAGADTWAIALALRDGARRHIVLTAGEPDLAHESNMVETA